MRISALNKIDCYDTDDELDFVTTKEAEVQVYYVFAKQHNFFSIFLGNNCCIRIYASIDIKTTTKNRNCSSNIFGVARY